MELTTINNIRERYLALLSGDERYNAITGQLNMRAKEEPILTFAMLDAEADLEYAAEQRQLSEILLDMHAVNYGIIEIKNTIQETITSLDTHIETILASVQKQKTQAEDINTLCGKKSEYNSIIPVFTTDFEESGAEILDDKTLGAAIQNAEQISYDILDISGNGYSGNAFVYNDHKFENETDDRSNLNYIIDDNDTTVYEYSRLCTKDKTEAVSGIVNYDDKEVECVITLAAQSSVCKASVHSLDPGLVVKKIETSQDGDIFTVYSDIPLYINKTDEAFYDPDYIYAGGILCFPYAPYVRLTLASDTVTNDTIAIQEEQEVEETCEEELEYDPEACALPMPKLYIKKYTITVAREINAYRKKIAIQGIQLYAAEYNEVTVTTGNILEDSSVDKVSLFASEYIPDHFTDKEYIDYYLVINGQEYPVIPINSGRSGITMIRYSDEELSVANNTELIHETIKTIAVKITIRPYNGKETPYVSNIKLCLGKNTGNIYV